MARLSVYVGLYLESQAGRNLSVRYVRVERSCLTVFARFWGEADILALSRSCLYDYVLWLRQRVTRHGNPYASGTIERYVTAVRSFGEWLYRHGHLAANPADGFELMKPDTKAERTIPTQDEIACILDAVDSLRDRAMFELMYSSGLRVGEAQRLTLADLKMEDRILLVRLGKGAKDRYVPFSKTAQAWLVRYISHDRPRIAPKLPERGYVFLGEWGTLSWSRIAQVWKAACARVGLGTKGFTLHSIRHACATHLLENGSSVRYVQELLGHESLSTTQMYTRQSQERIKAMYRSFHPRENQHYEEVTSEYRQRVTALRNRLLQSQETQRDKRARGLYDKPGKTR